MIAPAPSSLSLTAISATRIDLSWTDLEPSPTPTTVEIQRKAAGGVYSTIDSVEYTGPDDTATYSDTTCAQSTHYYYRLRYKSGTQYSNYGPAVPPDVWTPPTAPSGLSVVCDAQTATLTWTNNGTYDYVYWSIVGYTNGSVAGNLQTATITCPAEYTTYTFKVGGYVAASGLVAYSSNYYATTGLNPPADLVATCPDLTSVKLEWADQSTAESGYEIYRDGELIDTTAAGVTSYLDDNLTQGDTHTYIVRTVVQYSTGSASLGSDKVTLTGTATYWVTSMGYATGSVFKFNNDTAISAWDAVKLIDSDTSLTLNSSYTGATTSGLYKIDLAVSAEATVTVTVGALDGVPVMIGAVPNGSSGVVVTWTDVATNATAFYIYRSTDDITYTSIDSVDPGVETYTDTDIVSNTVYYYKVRAYNASGYGDFSSVTTNPGFEYWTSGTNLITNGEFETDTTGWSGTYCSLASVTPEVEHSGKCLQMTRTSGTIEYADASIGGLTVGATYHLVDWVRWKNSTLGATPYKVWVEGCADTGSGGSAAHPLVSGTSTGTWVKIIGSFVATATSGTFHLEMDSSTTGMAILFDSITLWSVSPTGWTCATAGTDFINREESDVYDGTYSLRMDIDGSNSEASVKETLTVIANEKYKLSLAGEMTGTAYLELKDSGSNVWVDENGELATSQQLIALGPYSSWTAYALDIDLAVNADDDNKSTYSYTSYILKLYNHSAASSSIYLDDVQLTPVAYTAADLGAPTGIVGEVVSETQIKLTWTNNSPDADTIHVETQPAGGSYSDSTTTGTATTYTKGSLTNGTTYSFRLRASITSGGETVYGDYSTPYVIELVYGATSTVQPDETYVCMGNILAVATTTPTNTIDCYAVTKPFAYEDSDASLENVWKMTDRVHLDFVDMAADTPVTLSVSNDAGTTWADEQTLSLGTGDGTHKCFDFWYSPVHGQHHTFKIESDGNLAPFSFTGFDVYYEPTSRLFEMGKSGT